METNTKGTLDLSNEAINFLKTENTDLSKRLINLNGKEVFGYLDIDRSQKIKTDLSIIDIHGNDSGCTLPLYLDIDGKIVLVSMEHMFKCVYQI